MSIEFKNVDYVYAPGTPFQTQGLIDISFKIEKGSFVAIAGHTGSGKSTLMQHFDGLLLPSKGEITVAGEQINANTSSKSLKAIRKKVGLVFQFPENQLFEETVLKDVMFGPLNFGFSEQKAKEQAVEWIKKVGLSEDMMDKSPFELSGGQMRRVAIAGVMAYEPEILCLDEPAAGLDPEGQKQMFEIFKEYQRAGHTVILISHNMDDIALLADKVAIMNQGKLMIYDEPRKVFAQKEIIESAGLLEPEVVQLLRAIKQVGLDVNLNVLNKQEALNSIVAALRKRGIKC